MKLCPFCAEPIQDAAVVCRYCQREQPVPASSPEPAVRSSRLMTGAFVVLGALAVVILAAYAMAGEQREAAAAKQQQLEVEQFRRTEAEIRELEILLRDAEQAGIVTRRSCDGANETQVSLRAWLALNADAKRGLTESLSKWCSAHGKGAYVSVIDAQSGRTLAQIKGGRYTVY